MKIYNRKDFVYGIIMCLALPGRLLDGIQQWKEGEAGGLLWVAVVLAIAGKYFYNACNKVYNETDTAALELRRRAAPLWPGLPTRGVYWHFAGDPLCGNTVCYSGDRRGCQFHSVAGGSGIYYLV